MAQLRFFIGLFSFILFQSTGYSINKNIYEDVSSGVLLVGVCSLQMDFTLMPSASKEAFIKKHGKQEYVLALKKFKSAKLFRSYCSSFKSPSKQFFYSLRNTGSSFLINSEGYLVTNYHVVTTQKNVVVYDANSNGYEAKVARVVWSNKDHDLAIIKVENLRSSRKPLVLADPSLIIKLVNSDVWSLGFPNVSNISGVNLISFQAKSDKGVIRAQPEKRYLINKQSSTTTIEHSAYINSGNSGGPLVDHCGKVLGVNQSVPSVSRGRGIGWSVHVRHVLAGLKENRIQFKSSSNNCAYYTTSKTGGSSIALYIMGGLLFFLIIFVIRMYRKRNARFAELTRHMREEISRYFRRNKNK